MVSKSGAMSRKGSREGESSQNSILGRQLLWYSHNVEKSAWRSEKAGVGGSGKKVEERETVGK